MSMRSAQPWYVLGLLTTLVSIFFLLSHHKVKGWAIVFLGVTFLIFRHAGGVRRSQKKS